MRTPFSQPLSSGQAVGRLMVRVASASRAGVVLLIVFCAMSSLGAQSTISPAVDVPNPQFDWLYSKSIPLEARQQLLPLYQREAAILRQLDLVKWEAAQDTAGSVARGAAGVVRATNSSPTIPLAEESAAGAGQPGAEFRGSNAALAAQRGVDGKMIPSVQKGVDIVAELGEIDKQIGAIRKKYRIETIGPATLRPSELSDAAIAKIMSDAAKRAAQPVVGSTAKPEGVPDLGVPIDNGNENSFSPPPPGSAEEAARRRNEAIIANETLGGSAGQGRGGISFEGEQKYRDKPGVAEQVRNDISVARGASNATSLSTSSINAPRFLVQYVSNGLRVTNQSMQPWSVCSIEIAGGYRASIPGTLTPNQAHDINYEQFASGSQTLSAANVRSLAVEHVGIECIDREGSTQKIRTSRQFTRPQ